MAPTEHQTVEFSNFFFTYKVEKYINNHILQFKEKKLLQYYSKFFSNWGKWQHFLYIPKINVPAYWDGTKREPDDRFSWNFANKQELNYIS